MSQSEVDDLECAHCGSPDGIFRKRRNMILCGDCLHVPSCCIGCDNFNNNSPEEHPCSWCVRNKHVQMKDRYRKDG